MTMTVFEVPREHWMTELDAFTLAHEGWLVSVDVFGSRADPAIAIDRLPLLGVSSDRLGRDGTIAISVARSGLEHVTHLVRDVRRLYIELSIDGTTAGLLIESADAVRTVIELRASGVPVKS